MAEKLFSDETESTIKWATILSLGMAIISFSWRTIDRYSKPKTSKKKK